jgi:hypothetical protein
MAYGASGQLAVKQRLVPGFDVCRPELLQCGGAEVRDDLQPGELLIPLACLRRDTGIGCQPICEVPLDRNLVWRDVLAVIGALDQATQFLPCLADRAMKRLGEALAVDTPAQPPAIRTARVNAAVPVVASTHHRPLAMISAGASVLPVASGVSPGRNSPSSAVAPPPAAGIGPEAVAQLKRAGRALANVAGPTHLTGSFCCAGGY